MNVFIVPFDVKRIFYFNIILLYKIFPLPNFGFFYFYYCKIQFKKRGYYFMKKILMFLFIFSAIYLYSTGHTTVENFKENIDFWSGDIAKPYIPPQKHISFSEEKKYSSRSWSVADSVSISKFLNSTSSGNYFLDIYFNRNDNSLHSFCSDLVSITDLAKQAIDKAPRWIRPALLLKFQSIPGTKQNLWSNLILNTNDPYVDEVAFSIATLSPAYLMSVHANPQVILTNAQQIYQNDATIDYADVIDYGSSEDDNYYSTVRYWKMNEDGNLVQVEIPKRIYYWYIVHPEITDEVPAFIDPTILEYDHLANIVSPEEGYFWRGYLYTHTFKDTLNLQNMIQGCQYVWDGVPQAYPGGDWFAQPVSPYGDSLNYAIHIFTKWINGDMEFTSPGDRPHQPVRIAYKGMGRCGEYADLTAAVARALLIPATSISNWVNIWDHTFNELWLEDYIHYESYYWEWGTSFYDTYDYYAISPYEIRSDGYLRTVTEHYLDYSTLNVYVLDANDYPLDGAKVKLFVERPNDGIRQTMELYTNNQGLVTFTVSDSFPYYASCETVLGNYPASGVALLIQNPVDGETYNLALNLPDSLNFPQVTQINPPQDNNNDYKVEVHFEVPKYAIRGKILHNDIDGDYSSEVFDKIEENGSIDFFVTDQMNSDYFTAGLPFSAVHSEIDVNSSSYEFDIPDQDNWHFIFSTAPHFVNAQYIKGYVKLYQYEQENSNDDDLSLSNSLLSVYPNPFNRISKANLSIDFSLKNDMVAKIEIYNLKGEKVAEPLNKRLKAGIHKAKWDGKNFKGKPVASGLYLYKIKFGKIKTTTGKLILIR